MRAVWEGAGRARDGYGSVFDHRDFVAQMCRRVDRHLDDLLPRRFDAARVERLAGRPTWAHEVDAYTDMLSVPVWDLMDRSGERWRPIFGTGVRLTAAAETPLMLPIVGTFRQRPALGFSDCLLVELARKAGHLSLGTCDRGLSRLDGATRL